MDVEAARDDISVEDGSFIVYTDIFYTVKLSRSIWRKKPAVTEDNIHDPNVILRGASGALRPGRMTFILGPSGAGKTTLLKILAGRKKTGVTGCLYGAGRSSVLVAQDTTVIDTLTAGETLRFAARLKLPNVSQKERTNAITTVTKQLGIHEVLNTSAGRLSGGERKRLIIACELLTDPTIMLLDEPTSGLDAVSSLSVARALHTVARSGRTIACVLHQPSSQLFNIADDVIVLANGRTLYAGAIADIPSALTRAGFMCPQYYNIADYLLEVASNEHPGDMNLLEHEANSYAHEMSKIAKSEICNGKGTDLSPESVALLNPSPTPSKGYAASVCQQLSALLWRCYIGVVRDVYLTQIRLVCHFVVALLLGALYHGAGADAGRMMSNTGCLFFFLLFLFFSNAMPTIHTFPVEAKVVLHEHLNKWYSLPAYCASKIIVDLPIQLLCATVFLFPAWYLTSQPLEPERMALAWLTCALVTILAQTFGFVVGASCGMKLGLFVIPAANIPMLMFSEFFIPYREMPVYLRPFATISYFRYAFDAFLETVYGMGREKLPCHEVFCMFKNPVKHLEFLGLSRNLHADYLALVLWIVMLQIALVVVLLLRVYKACR
ncbi:ATP-binding cassette sub-family G member 4-like isoform X1 [Spodoptera litura]|uniref:ATP-binding cassette sub-family G member 4-like isoform X1 n=1 Tax=Spodoptera litura TaxID=69820 RepID=A0A9J7DSG5_SPOLT|nr:ATP-binding cassette sub-family G member 4-like isoform X1 [Spodoptera litura]